MKHSTPDDAAHQLQAAFKAYQAGNLAGATTLIDAVLQRNPRHADAHWAKGTVLMASGDERNALTHLLRALQGNPGNVDALHRATVLSLNLHEFVEAEKLARRLVTAQPKQAQPHYLLASALRAQGLIREAITEVDQALAIHPGDVECLVLKARLLKSWQLPGLAVDVYRQALTHQMYAPAAIDLAEILLRESHPHEAIALLERAAQQLPEEVRPYALLGQAYTEVQDFAIADSQWALAERHARDADLVVLRRAKAEVAVGHFEEAEGRLLSLIASERRSHQAFSILTTARKMGEADRTLMVRMEEGVRSSGVSTADKAQVHYALGKSWDDLRDYERAIHHFDEANRISYEMSPQRQGFDKTSATRLTDFQIDMFAAEPAKIEENRSSGAGALFVIGMMRSGTTLTEHILSSHSQIAAGGEQAFWTERIGEVVDPERNTVHFTAAEELVLKYIKLMRTDQPDARYVIDKNPGNTLIAAALRRFMPGARFLHVRRHPVDNVLSMWMTPVSGDVAYTCNRGNLVFMYREYARLREHYASAIHESALRSFDYESLTSEPTSTISEMLGHLGVELEPSCFAPQGNRRTVLTPSAHQVRQPIHERSQQRWRNYEPWLGVFRELFEV